MAVLVMLFASACALYLTHLRTSSAPDATSLQARVDAIGAQLRAPADHNSMTVAISPIPQAAAMRFQIQADILRGMSNRQIILAMERRYGDGVLAAPAFFGFGFWVWTIPVVALLAGAAAYWHSLRRRTQTRGRPQAQWTGEPREDENATKADRELVNRLKPYL